MSEISKLEQNLVIKNIDKETVNISISNNETLMAIVGQFDQNLKDLGKLTNTNLFFRGNSITCKGQQDKIHIFCEALKFLTDKYFLTKKLLFFLKIRCKIKKSFLGEMNILIR